MGGFFIPQRKLRVISVFNKLFTHVVLLFYVKIASLFFHILHVEPALAFL